MILLFCLEWENNCKIKEKYTYEMNKEWDRVGLFEEP